MKVVASRRQSRTAIGGTDQPSKTRTGRKYRNRRDLPLTIKGNIVVYSKPNLHIVFLNKYPTYIYSLLSPSRPTKLSFAFVSYASKFFRAS
ncbi:hypothetical protein YC2023_114953 [Brassica napus]